MSPGFSYNFNSVPEKQVIEIPEAKENEEIVYLVTCHGACQDLDVYLTTEVGDADLYGR